MLWQRKELRYLSIILGILTLLLITFNILDIIYSTSLVITGVYYKTFSFLNIMPPSSYRSSILINGVYNKLTFWVFLTAFKNILLSFEIEFVAILIQIALVYYCYHRDQNTKMKNLKNILILYLIGYWIQTILMLGVLIVNSFSINDLKVLANNLGTIVLLFSLVKIALIGYCLYHWLKYLKLKFGQIIKG